jgi:predicted patatin/cPLA2 family phospholipase
VCATAFENQDIERFRDYPRLDLGIQANVSIVDAACATSAATSFFDAVNINGRLFRDGGFKANNPVNEVWHEARQIWIGDAYDVQLDQLLKCIISIGTGETKTESMKEGVKGFVETLTRMITQTRDTDKAFYNDHRNLTKLDGTQRYFRFNVDQGLQAVSLEQYEKKGTMEAVTKTYMESPERQSLLALCANILRTKTSVSLPQEIAEPDFS